MFKPYNQDQLQLFPPDLASRIPAGHPSRVVNRIIEGMDLSQLISSYRGIGAPSYHPKLMLKIVIYSYLKGIYSSRKIEQAVCEEVPLIWLSGWATPDHNTINRFRNTDFKPMLEIVFKEVIRLLIEEGLADIDDVYTDGTKIESRANRYTVVWRKNLHRYQKNIYDRIEALWEYAQSVSDSEENMPFDQPEMSAEKINETLAKIEEKLGEDGKNKMPKKLRAKLNRSKREDATKLEKYQQQEEIMGEGRNSYSKTDHDATFMRMKDDRLRKGQLKAAYNVQITTSNQIILHYGIYRTPSDTVTLIDHLHQYKKRHGKFPLKLTADATYGSEENYQFLSQNKIEAFVKYPSFQRENSAKFSAQIFHPTNLTYNPENDHFICPDNREISFVTNSIVRRKTGFESTVKIYQNESCKGCQFIKECHKSEQGYRTIKLSMQYRKMKEQANRRLNSEQGIKRRRQRGVDVEVPFANIKQNYHFRRFLLTTKEKVNIEFGLIALAHNIRKYADHLLKKMKNAPSRLQNAYFDAFFTLFSTFALTFANDRTHRA